MKEGKDIYNVQVYQKAFDLSLDWGQNWGSAINERIQRLNPQLSKEEIMKLNKECEEIISFGNKLIENYLKKNVSIKDMEVKLKIQYPKLSQQNIEKLLTKKQEQYKNIKEFHQQQKLENEKIKTGFSLFKGFSKFQK